LGHFVVVRGAMLDVTFETVGVPAIENLTQGALARGLPAMIHQVNC
jgi:hypothetical protein